jgi:hypothetical protein
MRQSLTRDFLWASLCPIGAAYFLFRGPAVCSGSRQRQPGPADTRPPGLAKQDKTPAGLERQGKTPEGWSHGKKRGWLERLPPAALLLEVWR